MNLWQKRNIWIVVLSIFAFGLSLLNRGIYSDDFVMVTYNQDPKYILETWMEGAYFLYWIAHIHNFIFGVIGNDTVAVLVERGLIFISFICSGIFFGKVLDTLEDLDEEARFFILMFFVLFPVNFVRFQLNILMYTFCYLLFYSGFYALSLSIKKKSYALRALSLLLFFFSFTTNAILPFYLVPILYCVYFAKNEFHSFVGALKWAKKNLDLLLLPVVFFVIKTVAFIPYGKYEGNYAIKLEDVELRKFVEAFYRSFIEPIAYGFNLKGLDFLAVVVLLIGLIFTLRVLLSFSKELKIQIPRSWVLFLTFGFLVFGIATFPYLAVGKMPSMGFLDGLNSSRHQMLLPLPAAFILYFLVRIFGRICGLQNRTRFIILGVLVLSFVGIHFKDNLEAQRDWYKQLGLVQAFKNSTDVKESTNLLIYDHTKYLNHKGRFFNFFEYTGLFKLAFGETTRLASNCPYVVNLPHDLDIYIKSKNYNFSDYVHVPPQKILHLELNRRTFDLADTVKLMGMELMDAPGFEEKIRDMYLIRVEDYSVQGCKPVVESLVTSSADVGK